MDLQTIITFEGKEDTLHNTMYKILWKWHCHNRSKDILVELLKKYTPLTEEECIDWVIELRPPDIKEWGDSEVGKQYIKENP